MMWTDERLARAALTAVVEPGNVTTANAYARQPLRPCGGRCLPIPANDGTHELHRSTSIGSWNGRNRPR